MVRYKAILFDFDGTIADTSQGIFESIQFAMRRMHMQYLTVEQMQQFIGPPLLYSFQHTVGMSAVQAEQAVEYYRENYEAGGQFLLQIYEGIPELLSELRKHGYKVGLASAKPDHFIRQILTHYHLDVLFDFAEGVSMEESYTDKSALIQNVLRHLNVHDLKTALMIGDKKYDIDGAHKAGIDAAGVLYGFGSLAELTDAGADRLFLTVSEMQTFLL